MNQRDFIRKRSGEWRWMSESLTISKKDFSERAQQFPAAYRRIIRDLNIARAEDFDPYLVENLDHLVTEGHSRMYGSRRLRFKPLANFISTGFPRILRKEWKLLTIFAAVFFGVTILSGLLVYNNPWLFSEWFSPGTASSMADMYNPESEHFLEPREVSGDADMFGYYIYNNISISFRVFAGGILAGFGSLLMMGYNALFLGAAGGYLTSLNYGSTFYSFIVGHGTVELLAIVFSGAAGWRIGWAVIRPDCRMSRKQSLKAAVRRTLPLIYGSVFFLVLAAGIEAFWSSRLWPNTVKYFFGAVIAVLVLLYALLAGRNRDVS